MAEPYVIHIQAVDQTFFVNYIVFHGTTILIGTPTPTPYIDTAKLLLSLGYDPARRLIMRRRGVDVNQLNYAIVYASQLGSENEANPPSPRVDALGL